MDEFKKYIRQNRPLLDEAESPPAASVWQKIEQHSVQGKPMLSPVSRWIAAACIVLLTGAAVFVLWPSDKGSDYAAAKPETQNLEPGNRNLKPETGLKLTGRTDTAGSAISPLPISEVIADNAGANTKKSSKQVPSKPRKESRPAFSKEKTAVDLLQENFASIINQQLKKLEATPIHVESPNYFHAFKKQWYDMEKDEKKIREDIKVFGLTEPILSQYIQLYQAKLLLLQQLQEEINKMNDHARQFPESQKKSPSFLKM